MVKYLSGRQKRRPQDKLTEDRYQYLGLDQAEPNLADPLTSPGVPGGTQYQLIAVAGYDGRRYWVPLGGELQPGAITIFDEGNPVSSASSVTQVNFVGAAVTAQVSVQSPSGHPGIAATVTVIPVTVGDNPPIGAGTTNNGELWWESDTGDLYVYYNDGDSSQWVMANSGGRGLTGDKGEVGSKGDKGQKGELGTTGSQGDKGDKGAPSTVAGAKGDKGEVGNDGSDGSKGDKGQKGEDGADSTEAGPKGDKGEVGDKGEAGDKGDKGEVGDKGQKGEVGDKGQKGQKGQKGEIGADSTVAGPKGEKGAEGNFGGATFDYTFSSSTGTPTDLNSGRLRLNNSSVSSATIMFIDDEDDNGTNIEAFLRTVDDSTSTIKGHVRISNKLDASDFALFTISSATEQSGFHQVGVSYVSGSASSFSNGEDIIVTFARTGDLGDKGQKGQKGEGGADGADGDKGDTGAKGQKGELNDKGQKGETGADNSTKGQKGEKGEVGADGGDGGKGQKGEVGADGGDGDKGQKGEVGGTGSGGSDGDKGQKGEVGAGGSAGSDGSDGDKGQKGEVGAGGGAGSKGQKGEVGADGGDGDKGQKGEVGDKGAQGSSVNSSVAISSSAPSSPSAGDLWWDSDDGDLHVYYNDGNTSQWVNTGGVGSKGQKGEVGTGDKGQKGEASTIAGDKGAKGEIGGAPVGQVVAWSGSASSLPAGYLLCDGSAVSRTTYAPLFAVVGTTHGAGDGSSTFNLPDLRDKFVLGASNSTGDTTYPGVSPGATGGSADAVVVEHRHLPQTLNNMTSTEAGGNTLAVNNTLVGNYGAGSGSGLGPLGNRHFMQNEGVSGTNKNLPPYYALAYIIQHGVGGDVAKGQKGEIGATGDKGSTGAGDKGQKGDIGAGAPVGQVVAWSGSASSLPAGYLLCDGSAISRSTYAALFSVIGTTHGVGDGSSTFNLPDLRDRFVVGATNSTGDTTWPGLSPGATGGSADNSLPSHYHNFPGDDQLTYANNIAGWSNSHDGNFSYDATSTTSGGGKMWRTSTEGTTGTNENLPPYYSLAYIIQFAQGGDAAKGQKGEASTVAGAAGDKGQKGEIGAGDKGQKGELGGGPVGQIVAWSGSAGSIPTGYFLCDGTAKSRSTYAALFTVVGTTHGAGDGSSTFNIPDLRDKFVVGASNSTGDTTYPGLSPAATGGQADATLVSHSHTIRTGDSADAGDSALQLNTDTSGYSNTSGIVNSSGSSATNANLPPYYSLAYIIQYAQGGDAAKGQKGETGSGAGFKKVRTAVNTGTLSGNYSDYTNVLNISSFTPNSTNSVFLITVTIGNFYRSSGSGSATGLMRVNDNGTQVDGIDHTKNTNQHAGSHTFSIIDTRGGTGARNYGIQLARGNNNGVASITYASIMCIEMDPTA